MPGEKCSVKMEISQQTAERLLQQSTSWTDIVKLVAGPWPSLKTGSHASLLPELQAATLPVVQSMTAVNVLRSTFPPFLECLGLNICGQTEAGSQEVLDARSMSFMPPPPPQVQHGAS